MIPAAEAKKIAPAELTKEEFGRVHGQHHGKYKTGIDEIGAGMTGLSNALMNLGGNIGTANARYASNEEAASTQATNAGALQISRIFPIGTAAPADNPSHRDSLCACG